MFVRPNHWMLAVVLPAILAIVGCGSPSAPQQGVNPAPVLPPAVAAPEPVLLYVGAGTTSTDVTAVESVLGTLGFGYRTADATQLDAMSEQQLAGYKLIIVPGGNSITIGESLTSSSSTALRGAVQQYGVHYLGICAGAFFGGSSIYNGVDLTGGVAFNFYGDEFKGIHVEPVEISFPSAGPLDVYWQDGPELSGWGEVVAKFPDGTAAITEGQSGKGFVLFTGIHAEAPASWRGSFTFTTSESADLAYAGRLVEAAYTGTTLPHF